MKKLILLLAVLFVLAFSFFAWYELIFWIEIVKHYPDYSHLERQEVFIQEFAGYFFVSKVEQLYFAGVIIALFSMLNVLIIIILQSRLHKFIFLFLFIQGFALMIKNIWEIL